MTAKILRHPVCANDFNVRGVIYEISSTDLFGKTEKNKYVGDGRKNKQINLPPTWESFCIKEQI